MARTQTTARRSRDDANAGLPVPPQFETSAPAPADPSGETAAPPLLSAVVETTPAGMAVPVWAALPWFWPMIWWTEGASVLAAAWARSLPSLPAEPPRLS